jgi:hypothetical protein
MKKRNIFLIVLKSGKFTSMALAGGRAFVLCLAEGKG